MLQHSTITIKTARVYDREDWIEAWADVEGRRYIAFATSKEAAVEDVKSQINNECHSFIRQTFAVN